MLKKLNLIKLEKETLMVRTFLIWMLALIAIFIVSACQCSVESERELPKRVNIVFHGAVVAPSKANGHPWDGPPKYMGDFVSKGIAKALTRSNAYGAVIAFLADEAIKAFDAPDVSGKLTYFLDKKSEQAVSLKKAQNEYRPNWSVSLKNLTYSKNVSILLELNDVDLKFDDKIGSVRILFDQLEKARNSGGEYVINTSSQSETILFVIISIK